MTAAFERTFELLAATPNEAAVPALVAALEGPERASREAALRASLHRRHADLEHAVLAQWEQWGPLAREGVAHRVGWLSSALKSALVGKDAAAHTACRAALELREYDLIPTLLEAAADETHPARQLAGETLVTLAELLHDEVHSPRDYRIRRDPLMVRQHALAALESALTRPGSHPHREWLEAFLLLAPRDNAFLKGLLQSPTSRLFAPLAEIACASPRAGVVRLLVSFIDDPFVPAAGLELVARRRDITFLRQLLRRVGGDPGQVIRNNLRRIEDVPWLVDALGLLDALSEAEQAGAVHLACGSGVERRLALAVVSYLLRNGRTAGRRAAAAALAAFPDDEARQLAQRGMDDSDPLVRAAIIPQLRERRLPGALEKLVELLDSPHPVEREAAQTGLAEFEFQRYLALYDSLDDEARRSTGRLVRKVDPTAAEQLAQELAAPSRSRRRRALEMAMDMAAVEAVQDSVAALVRDDDPYLRAQAVRALATAPTDATRQVLREALLDHEPVVQEAAERALAELARLAAAADPAGGER